MLARGLRATAGLGGLGAVLLLGRTWKDNSNSRTWKDNSSSKNWKDSEFRARSLLVRSSQSDAIFN